MIIPTLKEMLCMCLSDKREAIHTVSCFVLLIVLVSVCGWCAIPYPPETPRLTLTTEKSEIIRLTPRAMAAETDRTNREMEARARGDK